MDDLALAFEAAIVGRSCRVERREADWAFDLRDNVGLAVGCHWRLVSAHGIALTDEDDGQGFGLPEPVDAEANANNLLAGATVSSATVDRVTADLCLRFSNGLRLDLLNNSAGYECWQGSFNQDGKAVTIIATGAVASPASECRLWDEGRR
ncbi:DUF6188 family protein [Brevundimonas sp.]|uniref:DUF6188 family protein n=1 Tax=Brevundimonas sp. TaxID=1871086 RepID=UPI0028AC616F|nr:DUF6188 family protein [Brevundimonas sp.]